MLKYESDMMLISLKQRTFNWSPNVPIFISKSMCVTHWSGQFHFPDLYIVVMVYPCYVHYDLPSCCVLLLSWFGNKLSIQYIMNLSSANYPYFWSLFFCVLVPDYINARTILQHTWALSSESSDSTQVFTGAPLY